MWYYYVGLILIIFVVLLLIFRKQIMFLIVGFTSEKRVQRKILKQCKTNDFLTMSDVYFPIENGMVRHIDTFIFGNKYIYLVKIIKQVGRVYIDINDSKWRVVYKNQLTNISNPLVENRRRIDRILAVVPGIERKDMKSIVAFTSTCTFDPINNQDFEFVVHENEIVKAVVEIEKHSTDDVFAPDDVERYANAFYEYGLEAERKQKELKKNEKARKI